MLLLGIEAIFVMLVLTKNQERHLNETIHTMQQNSETILELGIRAEQFLYSKNKEDINKWYVLHTTILNTLDGLTFTKDEIVTEVDDIQEDMSQLLVLYKDVIQKVTHIEAAVSEFQQSQNLVVSVRIFDPASDIVIPMDVVLDSEATDVLSKDPENTEEVYASLLAEFDNTMMYVMQKNMHVLTVLQEQSVAYRDISNRVIFYTLMFISIFLVLLNILTVRPILSSLTALQKGALRFSKQNFSEKIPEYGDDEVSAVAKAFNTTALELDTLYKDLDKKVEQRTSELQKFQHAVESSTDGVIITDSLSHIAYVNDAFVEMAQTKKNVLYKKDPIQNLFSNEIDSKVIQDVKKAIKHKRTYITEQMILAGSKLPVRFSVYPIAQKNGTPILVMLFQDISHLKEISKMKTEFVSIASHQLRTPLTAINWHLELLLGGEVGKINKKQKAFISDIYTGSKRMVKLVNDLLNVSRLEAGRLAIVPQPVQLETFLEDIVKEVEILAKASNCIIQMHMPKKRVPEIQIDPDLVRQVVHNFLTNAIRYSPKGESAIDVTLAYTDENGYCIAVKDTGIGIPKKDQGHIFRKFYRADNAVSAAADGSGLGMYVARLIGEASGGRVWFTSAGKGKGTTFFLSLPKGGSEEKNGETTLAK